MRINLKDVKTLAPVPAGDYEAVLTEFNIVESAKSSGKPYVAVTFKVTGPDEFKGRNLWKNYSLQSQALWGLKRDLVAMGVDPDSFGEDDDIGDIMTDAKGRACVLEVGLRPYNGEDRNEVKRVKEPGLGLGF